MKKNIIIFFLFLTLTVINFSIKPNSIYAGPLCDAAEGQCLTFCNANSTDLGTMDCTPQASNHTEIPRTCCIYQALVVKFNCVSGQCIADPNGSYPNLGECSKDCYGSGASKNPECIAKSGKTGINTAIGCIPVENTNEFMGWILGWAIGVGGGIAFLLIIYASFMVMTSQVNPEKLKAGQELLTSAISGLIMLIFSVFILRFIGIDILKLDKFGFGQ